MCSAEERINAERLAPIPESHLDIGPAVLPGDLAVAAADVQNKCSRRMLLGVVDEEIGEDGFARPRRSENQSSELIAFMQVEVIRRLMIRF